MPVHEPWSVWHRSAHWRAMSSVVTCISSHSRRDKWSQELLERAYEEPDPQRAEDLRTQVVIENQPLAAGIACQFDNKGMEHDDLVQVAMVGLVQAARRYQPGAGHGFAAFAGPTIRGELKRHFRDHGWAVRPPRALQEMCSRVRGSASDLEQELRHSPSDDELADYLDVSAESVRQAHTVDDQYRSESLDAPLRGTSTEVSLGDSLADVRSDPYDRAVTLISLRSALGRLGRRERVILRLRFVDELTQQQIGHRIGVSQMQVSRLLRNICRELRTTMEDRGRQAPATARGWKSAG